MDRHRWQEIEQAFHAALAVSPESRRDHLDQLRAGDPELADEVASMLAASDTGDERIEGVVTGTARTLVTAASERFGVYRVLGIVGEGGLSTVYLGERDDATYRRQVAIKVIKRGMDSAEIERRLHLERQILASLEHPNIAALLDGGRTEDGQAYFVLEYIEGQPIDAHCDQYHLSVEQRLALFRSVCDAVDHAHRNLVIHRDIKPSNVLVTSDGVPKLLDFGIAKLLTAEFEGLAALHTATGLRLMTPEYASPEQIDGAALTTGSDVYALGVLLYRLLTGQSPYRFPEVSSRQAIETAVRSQIARPPSAALSPPGGRLTEDDANAGPDLAAIAAARSTSVAGLRRRLAGDLDTIVSMALRKEPHRRYRSAAELATDIERHLRALPVRARPDTWRYRATTFARRHTAAVIATTGIFVALVGGIVTTTLANQRAQRHLAEATEVSRLLTELFEVPDPAQSQGRDVTARDLLDLGSARIDRELAAQPSLRRRLMTTMGLAYHGLGEDERAGAMLEGVVDERRSSLGGSHPLLAASLRDLARVRQAESDYDAARTLLDEALVIERSSIDEDGLTVADTLDQLAGVARHESQLDEAEALHREALTIRQERLAADDPKIEVSWQNLAETLFARHDVDGAERLFRQVLDQRRARLGDLHPDVALTLNDLAVVLHARGAVDESVTAAREVVEIRQTLYGEDHWLLAQSYGNLAEMLRVQGMHVEAGRYLQRALEISRRELGEQHPYVALFTKNLGIALQAAGRLEDAEQQFRASLNLRRARWGEHHPEVAQSLYLIATVRAQLGDVDDAQRLNAEAIQIQDDTLQPDAFPRSYPLVLQGRLLAATGACNKASAMLDEAERIRRIHLDDDDPRVAEIIEAAAACRR